MNEQILYTIIGYLVFAIVFFPLLVFNQVLWVGVVVLVTIVGSVLFGQCLRVMVRTYKKKMKK